MKKSPQFEYRNSPSVDFQHDVAKYLESQPDITGVARNGSEDTHTGFVDEIRHLTDPASKALRFQTDGVARTRTKSFEWEVKTAIDQGTYVNIEKDAYTAYMNRQKLGIEVRLYVRRYYRGKPQVYWQYIENVQFIDSYYIVNALPHEMRHPIDEDGWICPRDGSGYAGKGSGTPYKRIDLTKMIPIPDFYEEQRDLFDMNGI